MADWRQVTLLAEDLGRLAASVMEGGRYPILERIWSRGYGCHREAASPDHLRFALFGIDIRENLPVAALTQASDGQRRVPGGSYWLRVDPVTMRADMARVFMTHHGFADLDPLECNEVENCVRDVLREEGIHLHSGHAERWCIALDKPLPFEFTHLDLALGMDVAEALPDHAEARYWRRVLTEIQVALHNCPVNISRRRRGLREINSVWFWGGGFIPEASPESPVDAVYSDHPVSRGLAIIHDCVLHPLAEAPGLDLERDGRSVLIDWTPRGQDAVSALADLEGLATQLAALCERNDVRFDLIDGGGSCRSWSRRAAWRFWRRSLPLFETALAKNSA